MPERKYTQPNSGYRYGFNGKERDTETTSTTTYDYGFRIYNPGLGKFLSVDPLYKEFPWNSVYAFAENDVIRCIDLEGRERSIIIYDFSTDKITKTKIDLPVSGELGNGILVQSNHGGVITYYYGDDIPDANIAAFKKVYEGVVLDAKGNHMGYLDSKNLPTIGYGHLIKKGEPYTVGGTITEEEAQSLFQVDQGWIFKVADKYLKKYSLSENQRNALYDASFNLGPGKMSQYDEDNGRFSGEFFFLKFMGDGEGVKKRRFAENLLYSENVYIHFEVYRQDKPKEKSVYKKAEQIVKDATLQQQNSEEEIKIE